MLVPIVYNGCLNLVSKTCFLNVLLPNTSWVFFEPVFLLVFYTFHLKFQRISFFFLLFPILFVSFSSFFMLKSSKLLPKTNWGRSKNLFFQNSSSFLGVAFCIIFPLFSSVFVDFRVKLHEIPTISMKKVRFWERMLPKTNFFLQQLKTTYFKFDNKVLAKH